VFIKIDKGRCQVTTFYLKKGQAVEATISGICTFIG
jgi:hypothetical protein